MARQDLPIGVYRGKYGRYYALKSVKGKLIYLGSYLTVEEASQAFLTGSKLPSATIRQGRPPKKEQIEELELSS